MKEVRYYRECLECETWGGFVRLFRVIDTRTGKEANPEEIALQEEWAQSLVWCDMDGFYIGEDGSLILADECGNFVFCDTERFKIVWQS